MTVRRFAAGLLLAGLLAPAAVLAQSSGSTGSDDWGLSGGDSASGQKIFAGNGCGWCHEGSGRRRGRAPQLMDTKRSDAFIATRILNGKPGRMPAFGGSFGEQQIKDLIAFIRSLKPEDKP
ncbi:Cytochrome c, mono- and diheme variants [Tistlia consotensis]|uniref:Cytochrome c, mono-and diheme variants n=1 Tax=Tistlia consotensis USBA 355 TaxID=560819 RepID=A0A1Y6CQN3_9PROT|nr:c-type cytochrome [Tistlia consotensis]SMF82371.1 Cytochrome c, mono-and diheme variants [Tistlia consotensis USBA 355]SNS27459.1 Cytochrome c, mono- and diheme variants [Tistlia consotensis]